MDKYKLVLQIFAILFICYLGYLLVKIFSITLKKNRLSEFSLNIDNERDEKNVLFKFIYKFSGFLDSLVIFNTYAKTYDKYIYDDSRLKNGMDYVSLKVLLGICLILLYLFMIVLYNDIFHSWMLLVSFVVGFIIPDFYCLVVRRRRYRILNRNILGAVIIMNNSYKANESTEQAIMSVIDRIDGKVAFEFKRVLNDINMGISIDEAFFRMYRRVGSSSILYISRVLQLVSKSGISVIDAFSVIENELIDREKFNNEILIINKTNRFSLLIFTILPLIFISTLVIYNKSYVNIFTGYIGSVILSILLIMYLFYLIVIHHVYRGDSDDK